MPRQHRVAPKSSTAESGIGDLLERLRDLIRQARQQALLAQLAERLTAEFGKGFDASNLYKMPRFYRLFCEFGRGASKFELDPLPVAFAPGRSAGPRMVCQGTRNSLPRSTS